MSCALCASAAVVEVAVETRLHLQLPYLAAAVVAVHHVLILGIRHLILAALNLTA
jgi:hypothetical protein